MQIMQKIGVFRLSALGDVLMFLPTIRALQRAYPKAQVYWIISNPAYQLVQNIDDIHFIVLDKPRHALDYWHLYQEFKAYRFDVLLAAQASFRAHTIMPMIKAKRKIGYDKKRGKEGHGFVVSETIPYREVHTLDGFMQFAQALGVKDLRVEWRLPLEPAALEWVKAQTAKLVESGPLVMINPCASKPERSWHLQGYLDVISYLKVEYRANIILCGGPSRHDRDMADGILAHYDLPDYVGKTKLQQLLALIAQADLVLCPDTGPSHMAAALGTPVISLHGVTKPEISGPYGQLEHCINVYPQALETFAAGLKKDWYDKVHHPEVMNLIKSEAVIQKIKQLLA